MLVFKFLLLCGFLTSCHGEILTAFYVSEDKLSIYPNDPNMTENKDLYNGFTLKDKDRIFKGKEYDEEVIKSVLVWLQR